MALIFCDGCETGYYVPNKWDSFDGWTISSGGPVGGEGHFMLSGGSYQLTRTLGTNITSGVLGFYFRPQSDANFHHIVELYEGSNNNLRIVIKSLQLYIFRGATQLAGPTSITLDTSTWYHVELVFTIDNSGSYNLYIDGTSYLSGSDDTQIGTNAYINKLVLSCDYSSHGFDDIYLLDSTTSYNNSRIGAHFIKTTYPYVDATYKESTPSTGVDRFATVDGIDPSPTSYNILDFVGTKDTFNVDIIAEEWDVLGVQVSMVAARLSGSTLNIKSLLRYSSSDAIGTELTLTESYINNLQILNTLPTDLSMWTRNKFNSSEFGYIAS